MRKTNRPVFLWGMMGAGKTTAGNYLKDTFGLNVFDLDAFIENKAGNTIPELFKIHGEIRFREMEALALQELCHAHSPYVIVTGGGTPCYHQNDEWMSKNGLTIFIDCPISLLTQRITSDHKHRPLLNNLGDSNLEEQLVFLLKSRRNHYEKAHYTVKVVEANAWMPTIAGLILAL